MPLLTIPSALCYLGPLRDYGGNSNEKVVKQKVL